jgi:hypothetical protein
VTRRPIRPPHWVRVTSESGLPSNCTLVWSFPGVARAQGTTCYKHMGQWFLCKKNCEPYLLTALATMPKDGLRRLCACNHTVNWTLNRERGGMVGALGRALLDSSIDGSKPGRNNSSRFDWIVHNWRSVLETWYGPAAGPRFKELDQFSLLTPAQIQGD